MVRVLRMNDSLSECQRRRIVMNIRSAYLGLVGILSIASVASAATIEAIADSSIREGSGSAYVVTTNLPLAYSLASKGSYKAYLKFDVSSVDLDDPNNAEVILKVASLEQRNLAAGAALRLYGLHEGATAGGTNPTEADWSDDPLGKYIVWTIEGHLAPGNNPTAADKLNGMDLTQATLLGAFSLGTGPLTAGQVITLSGQALSQFVRSDTNGVVTLVLTVEGANGQNVNLAAREHAEFLAPTLEFVPEPATLGLVAVGLAVVTRRRR
jgi:hypothetical protein